MIVFAVENNGYVKAYNEKKVQILNVPGKLYNYTVSSVVILTGENTYDIYNESGSKISTYPYGILDMSNVIEVNPI